LGGIMNRFGRWLVAQRTQRHWSQIECAEFLRVDKSLLARWEAGEMLPRLTTFARLMRLLGADANEVLRLVQNWDDTDASAA